MQHFISTYKVKYLTLTCLFLYFFKNTWSSWSMAISIYKTRAYVDQLKWSVLVSLVNHTIQRAHAKEKKNYERFSQKKMLYRRNE